MPVAPCLETFVCLICNSKWNAFFPMGRETDNDIECPECGNMSGRPL